MLRGNRFLIACEVQLVIKFPYQSCVFIFSLSIFQSRYTPRKSNTLFLEDQSAMVSLITIQSSFEEVLDDCKQGIVDEENIWINRRQLNHAGDAETEYYSIPIEKGSQTHYSNGQITITPVSSWLYNVHIGDESYILETGEKVIPVKENINSISLTSNTSVPMALVAKNFEVDYCNLKEKNITNELGFPKEEVNDILRAYLFPSNSVIITVNLNYSCNIYAFAAESVGNNEIKVEEQDGDKALYPKPVRTFTGHKKSITSLQLIGSKGRNFLTGSRDGKINLWDCGSGLLVKSFYRIDGIDDPINDIVLGSIEPVKDAVIGDSEFETEGKCFFAAYDSGVIQQFDIVNHNQTKVRFEFNESVAKLVNVENKFLVSGHNSGYLNVWSLDSNSKVFGMKFNEEYPVNLIEFIELKEDVLELVLYNGPETLLRIWVNLVEGVMTKMHYMVGLPEVFQLTDMARNKQQLYVVGDGIFYSYKL